MNLISFFRFLCFVTLISAFIQKTCGHFDEGTYNEEDLSTLESILKNADPQRFIDYMDRWRKEEMNVAVLGKSAVGKSSFINKVLGFKKGDPGFAEVGTGDTTKEPKRYQMPKNNKIALWDMPGIGTPSFKMETAYLNTIEINRYDFCLILYCTTIEEGDIWLTKQLLQRNKPFAFVRTKVDELLDDDLPGTFSDRLKKLNQHFEFNMRNANIHVTVRHFAISNKDLKIADFDKLLAFILNSLPIVKRHTLLMSMDGVTAETIMKKKELLMTRRTLAAAAIGTVNALPFPVIEIPFNFAILRNELQTYIETFSLDPESINSLPKCYLSVLKVSLEIMNSGIDTYIKYTLAYGAWKTAESAFEFSIPIIGSLITGGTTFVTFQKYLGSTIDQLAEEALLIHSLKLFGGCPNARTGHDEL